MPSWSAWLCVFFLMAGPSSQYLPGEEWSTAPGWGKGGLSLGHQVSGLSPVGACPWASPVKWRGACKSPLRAHDKMSFSLATTDPGRTAKALNHEIH